MTVESQSGTCLYGRALVLARVTWLVLALLALGLVFAGIPNTYQLVAVVRPETAAEPAELGLSPALLATYTIALDTFGVLGFAFFAGLIDIAVTNNLGGAQERRHVTLLFLLLGRTVRQLALFFVPITMTFAILRYRLWDIDVLINRTLVYGILTALLALVYAASVILLQALLRAMTGQRADLAIIASTLAIAALFNPLRRRVQDFIDWRFYRRRYDGEQTLAAVSATLREEVDLNRLTAQFLSVVEETMQPTYVTLWLRDVPVQGSNGEDR